MILTALSPFRDRCDFRPLSERITSVHKKVNQVIDDQDIRQSLRWSKPFLNKIIN